MQMTQTQPSKSTYSTYASPLTSFILVAIVTLFGIIYTIFQWILNGRIADTLFISMLIGATMILIIGLKNFHNFISQKSLEFFAFTLPSTDSQAGFMEYQKLKTSVFNATYMTFSGIIYGLAVGSAPLIFHSWQNQPTLAFLLMAFLFSVNYVTGIAFCGLIMFFLYSLKIGKMVKIELWQRENPSTAFLTGSMRRMAVLASIYISICLSSILFSTLPFEGAMVGYSVFSGIVILSILIVPLFPIVQKISIAKNKALNEIDAQIQHEFQKMLDEAKAPERVIDSKKIESLLLMREKVHAIEVWPFKLKVFGAGASVIVVSSVPVILQFILSKLK